MDVDRGAPLAKANVIAQSRLVNDIQANQAAIKAAEAQVEQAELNLEFTNVKSRVASSDGWQQ
jgi:multidrug resistance efflux pump